MTAPGEVEAPLPRLLHEDPVAVVVLDRRARTVLHASTGAVGLDEVSGLPVPAGDWARAARLVTPGGRPFPDGQDPVSRAVRDGLVPGEQVWALAEGGHRPLWATGFPLPAVGEDEHALLVLFDVDAGLPSEDADLLVRDRAIVAAGLSFTLADPRLPDTPLVFVNPAFERTTGYTAEEALGRNCRFLQGPGTDPAAVQRVRDALAAQERAVVVLLNTRKDGSAFWNELSLSPVYDGAGTLTHYVGIQADVTARVLAEQERERHLQAEQDARRHAEQNEQRLALLADATSQLAATLDVDEALRRLADLLVPTLGDWCTLELLDPDGDEPTRFASRHADPGKDALLSRVERLTASRTAASPVARVLRSGEPLLLPTVPEELLDALDEGDELAATYRALGTASAVVVPLAARRQVLGVLTVVRAGGPSYDRADLRTVGDLARRAALAVDNARLYSREHALAEQLQRSLLPQLPELPGVEAAASYLPGSSAAQVGGDWYDLFALPDGAVGLAVGDVMGHDLSAAAAMGQLRSVLRSYAWQGSGPAEVLDSLDHLVQGLEMAQLATVVYGRLDLPVGGAPGRLVMCNAGHLPPVLRRPDGTAVLLDAAPSQLVGAPVTPERRDEAVVEVPAGSTLVLCTDGLVERRGLDPDEGLERLRAAVERGPAGSAEALRAALLAELATGALDDDVALLVLRVAA